MRRLVLFLGLLSLSNFIYSQNDDWLTYTLDSVISIDMPNEVIEMDTTAQGMGIHQIFSQTENSLFIVQKAILENENKGLSGLPYDRESLEIHYDGLIEGIAKSIPHKLSSREMIEIENFIGYKLIFVDSLNLPKYEMKICLLNKHLYSFYYGGLWKFDENEKNLFFDSIKIDHNQKISQFLGEDQSYRAGYLVGKYFIYILVFIVVLFVIFRKKKKSPGILN